MSVEPGYKKLSRHRQGRGARAARQAGGPAAAELGGVHNGGEGTVCRPNIFGKRRRSGRRRSNDAYIFVELERGTKFAKMCGPNDPEREPRRGRAAINT